MTDKKEKSTQKGDFIDLEGSQYKKKSSFNKYLFFLIFLIFVTSSVYFFSGKFSENNLLSSLQNKSIYNNVNDVQPTFSDSKISTVDKEEIENLEKIIGEMNDEIFQSKLKISETNSLILDLKKQIKILESQKRLSSDFYYAEKYLVLNDLLNLKNKFENRVNFDSELERLISRFNNEPEIKALIIYLQDIEIEKIINESELLNRLNQRIDYYKQDLDELINLNLYSVSNKPEDIFQSTENFFNYLKSLFNSLYKITKIDERFIQEKPRILNDDKLVQSLKMAKEYIILGDLNKSIKILSDSYFNDASIQEWLVDAEILNKSKDKFEQLEIKLLNIIGTEVD